MICMSVNLTFLIVAAELYSTVVHYHQLVSDVRTRHDFLLSEGKLVMILLHEHVCLVQL